MLDAATALADGRAAAERVAASHGAAVAAEVVGAARPRRRLSRLTGPARSCQAGKPWSCSAATSRPISSRRDRR